MGPPDHRPELGWRKRSFFALVQLRPPACEHTEQEGELLRKYAENRATIVEIGVAEGGSAYEMRQVMAADGVMYLIDPHVSCFGKLSPARLVAHRLVGQVTRGDVRWIQEFSPLPADGWSTPIDFLFIDGDHSHEGVSSDWELWTPHLASRGHVALHDARLGVPWTHAEEGPVVLLRRLRDDPGWTVVDEVDSLAVLRRAE